MAIQRVIPLVLITVIAKCRCEATNGYNTYNSNDAPHFGQLLKPPPPPLPILPVPFNSGMGNLHNDFGYQYQTPPPLPSTAPPILPLKDLKLPAPFYRQYNFNFVPPPQPFATTPSPTMFQKISGWLFPAQQTSSDISPQVNNNHNTSPLQGNCNPCNLVPWIPVIRYDLPPSNVRQNAHPTYGPPSPTATTSFNSALNLPQAFTPSQNNYKPPIKLSTGTPHATYGLPTLSHFSSSFNPPSSTYGPPSPTHTVSTYNQATLNSPYSMSSSSLFEVPNTSLGPSSSYRIPSSSYTIPDSTYKSPLSSYGTPAYNDRTPSSTHSPISSGYKPELLNHYLPTQNDVEILSDIEPSSELQLPKVTHPTGFRNSYGEPILNTYAIDIPFSVTATGAASSKIKTEVLPESYDKLHRPNMSIELANPAPFSLNRGRNIHTLQPVALPNLSVSPLPPIFNARPFRIITPYSFDNGQSINTQHNGSKNFNIAKSIPVAEYTHSVEYPTNIIQSPVIDIDDLHKYNRTKDYRNIQNSYVINEFRDISPQASEDHISAANSNQDVSFESIGNDFTNELYDSNVPMDLKKPSNSLVNHKVSFADLRGVKDEDVDKYRTESNLQHIDSPLLYLKPSAPHKNYNNFFFMMTTPGKQQEYEIYDDIPTTTESMQPTLTSGWDESRHYLTEHLSPLISEEKPKIVQIIVPYTNAHRSDVSKVNFAVGQHDLINSAEEKYQARKIQSNTDNNFVTITTQGYNTLSTSTEQPLSTTTENYDLESENLPADFYDVKEPPFDIVKLQHTIDDWTEQEYSKDYNTPHKTRSNAKYAKQIPDEFFTTITPFTHNYATETNNYNIDLYDHEGSSSMHHIVTDNETNINSLKRKQYNTIERLKSNYNSDKNEETEDTKKLHIYTAASTFRSTTTTTPAPWGQIQTSISPLTNEKIYVVTSKPWRDKNATREYDDEINQLESKESMVQNEESEETDNLPFKSPRFNNRPPYGFTADAINSIKLDGFSRGWYRRINNLEYPTSLENGSLDEDLEQDSNNSRSDEENN